MEGKCFRITCVLQESCRILPAMLKICNWAICYSSFLFVVTASIFSSCRLVDR
jgi:hypothetical protein